MGVSHWSICLLLLLVFICGRLLRRTQKEAVLLAVTHAPRGGVCHSSSRYAHHSLTHSLTPHVPRDTFTAPQVPSSLPPLYAKTTGAGSFLPSFFSQTGAS